MKFSAEDIAAMAEAAKFNLDGERERIEAELESAARLIEILDGLEAGDAAAEVRDLSSLRADIASPGLSSEEAFKNAPARSGDYFAVPYILI